MDKFKALDPTLMYFLGFKEKEDDYEIQDEKTFPMSEAGRTALRTWLWENR